MDKVEKEPTLVNNEGEKEENALNNEEENEEDDQTPSELIHIKDKARTTIYIVLVCISGFSACDGGICPQQIDYLKKDFKTNKDSTVGFFGSVDYIGRVIGALLFSAIMGKMNRKMLLVFCLLFKALTLLTALLTPDKIVNIIARGLSGIAQVFFTTYLPVWCDQYGKERKRTLMVTIVQLGGGLGIIFGYGLGLICEELISTKDYSGWRTAFAIEGIILIVCGIIIFSFKNKYFSNNFVLVKDNEGKEEDSLTENNASILSNFGKMLCNKLFLFTTLANSVTFFGISIVQYWGDQYMEKVLEIEKKKRFVAFACLCLLGPILGTLFGGVVCSNLGGYGKRKTMVFIIILVLIASIFSEITALFTVPMAFIALSWFFLFFICGTISPESGIIISSLDSSLRGDGFSLCNCILNLIGNFPASYVFSLLLDFFEEKVGEYKNYRYAWGFSMSYNFIGLLFIIIAGIYRFKIKGDLKVLTSSNVKKGIDTSNIGKINDTTFNSNENQDNETENAFTNTYDDDYLA